MLLESYFHMFSVVLYSHDTLATPPEVKDGARQCDNVSPPCILGDDYRNPPNADALDILAKTKIHAKDDCGEVKGEHAKEMRVATHFVKKTGVKVSRVSRAGRSKLIRACSQNVHAFFGSVYAADSNMKCVEVGVYINFGGWKLHSPGISKILGNHENV